MSEATGTGLRLAYCGPDAADGLHAELPAGADAAAVADWLRANDVVTGLGADPDLAVQLFIEAATGAARWSHTCTGDRLAALVGTPCWPGTDATARWSLTVALPPATVDAVLAHLGDGEPRWRYAIVAATDPQSPAGRIRQRLLADAER